MKKEPITVRGARIEVGKKELLLILADFPSLSKVDFFYFIRDLIALERKVGKNECQPMVVWPKPDGTLEAQPASEWKEAIDARKINISELKSLPVTPPD